jgi:hypothetical protein
MGLYSITTRASGTVLTGEGSSSNIFNVDHINHVTHTAAPFLNSWEATVAQMNIETDPDPGGTVSLPASLSDEFERVRFVLTGVKKALSAGTAPPHWYTELAGFSNFVSPAPAAARREQTVAQPIPNNVPTPIVWDTTIYDTVGTMAGASGLTAPVAGTYIVGAVLGFGDGVSMGPSGDFLMELQRVLTSANTTALIALDEVFSNTTPMPKAISVETIAHFEANDVLKLFVLQTSGSTKTAIVQPNARPAIWMALVGR